MFYMYDLVMYVQYLVMYVTTDLLRTESICLHGSEDQRRHIVTSNYIRCFVFMFPKRAKILKAIFQSRNGDDIHVQNV